MRTFTLTVNGITVKASEGSLLADVIGIHRPCGGHGSCGKCLVKVNGTSMLSCQYRIHSDLTVEYDLPDSIRSETGISSDGHAPKGRVLALDLGTTTLALALLSPDRQSVAGCATATNPQRRFGADVISRIAYCAEHSPSELQRAVISEISRLISALGVTEADALYVSGNTVMLHLLFGIDCSSMGTYPYTPTFLGERRSSGKALGLPTVKEVVSLPSASAFLGADVVAGLSTLEMPPIGSFDLLIDLGTNAEIVLFNGERFAATSAAAGPCFEGVGIRHGMSATDGAIYSFERYYGQNVYKTVGGYPARGICGTGLIDTVACLLDEEQIDGSGLLEGGKFSITSEVALFAEDVRQLQLAKSAVCSAILTLMQQEGVPFQQIHRVYLSGGFSAQINPQSAARIGLLPRELATKITVLRNSSLSGVIRYASTCGDLQPLASSIRYKDLSSEPLFEKLFLQNMAFPDQQ